MKTTDTKLTALADFLECKEAELTPAQHGHDHYGLLVFCLGSQEYAIGTDGEADEAAAANIKDSLWAFRASFILSECGLPLELEAGIKAMQEKQCEDCNDALIALIEKTCDLKRFVQAAISADGRGHFLSSYNGHEELEGDFFIYRLN